MEGLPFLRVPTMPPAAQPPSPPDLPSGSRMSQWLLGPDPQQHEGIRLLGRVIVVHLCGLLLMGLTSLAGLVPAAQVLAMGGYFAFGWVLFFSLIRSGWTRQHSATSTHAVRAAYGMSTIVFAYATMDVARGVALQLLCLVLVMHVDRLRLRPAMWIITGSVAALIITLTGLQWLSPERIHLRAEIHNLMLATVMLPIAVLLINEAHRVSSRARQHSGELGTLLASLRAQSSHDELTGLPNPRHMRAVIEHEIKRHGRSGQPFCLTLFDVNLSEPTGTHELPPAAQRELADLVAADLSPADTLTLWSPGRWLLAQSATGLADARDTVERIQLVVRRHDWSHVAKGLRVALSAGTTEHQFGDTPDAMLGRAAKALQRARHEGLDHHATDPPLPPGARGNRALLNQLGRRPRPAAPRPAASPLARRPRPVMRLAPARPGTARATAGDWWPAGLQDLPHRIGELLLGADPAIRERLRLSLGGMVVYACWLALMLGYALPQGLITPDAARMLTVCDLLGMLVFYPLIRSGWTANWRDPQLALPQILFGTFVCAVGFAAVPDLRYAILQLACFVQLFGAAVLTAPQTRLATVSAIVLLLLALAWTWTPQADMRDFILETLVVATSCYVIATIGVQSYRFSQHRAQVQQEQGALLDTIERVRAHLIQDLSTGAHTRAYLGEWLEREAARHERTQQVFCVALMRLDPIVSLDPRQRNAVDAAQMQRLATLARTVLRETDLLGRWTPQEFLALLPDTAASPLCVQGLDRLRAQVALQFGPAPLGATLSCGIAEYRPGEPLPRLIERAQRGLHAARASGGNRCVLAD